MQFELDIRRGELRVVAALTDVFDGEIAFEEALAHVSGYRREKVRAYRFERDRRLSLLAGLLLDELLRERGLRERDMAYAEGDQGKPSFTEYPELHFSLAHSGEVAVAALADVPIGVDVERLVGFPRDIADPFAWTEMESVGKLFGTGVGVYVDSGDYRTPDDVAIEYFQARGHLVCLAAGH